MTAMGRVPTGRFCVPPTQNDQSANGHRLPSREHDHAHRHTLFRLLPYRAQLSPLYFLEADGPPAANAGPSANGPLMAPGRSGIRAKVGLRFQARRHGLGSGERKTDIRMARCHRAQMAAKPDRCLLRGRSRVGGRKGKLRQKPAMTVAGRGRNDGSGLGREMLVGRHGRGWKPVRSTVCLLRNTGTGGLRCTKVFIR